MSTPSMEQLKQMLKSPESRFPVLTGKKIPGRAPRVARWLRSIADRIEAVADRLDDRYESPLPTAYGAHSTPVSTIHWGSKYLTGAQIADLTLKEETQRVMH